MEHERHPQGAPPPHPATPASTVDAGEGDATSPSTERGLPFPGCQCRGILTNVVADALKGGGVGDNSIIEIVEPEGANTLDANGLAGTDPGDSREGFVGTNDTTKGRRRLALAREPENAMDVVPTNCATRLRKSLT